MIIFCPIGPWINTNFDPKNCRIEGFQNGTLVRYGKSSEHIWNWVEIIQLASRWITLEEGDVVLTGNPPDIRGGMRTSSPGMIYLNDRDTFTVKIDGLGAISNQIIFE